MPTKNHTAQGSSKQVTEQRHSRLMVFAIILVATLGLCTILIMLIRLLGNTASQQGRVTITQPSPSDSPIARTPSPKSKVTATHLLKQLKIPYDKSKYTVAYSTDRLFGPYDSDVNAYDQFSLYKKDDPQQAVLRIVDFSFNPTISDQEIDQKVRTLAAAAGISEPSTLRNITFLKMPYQFASAKFGEGGPRNEDGSCWGGGGVTDNYFITPQRLAIIVTQSYTEEGCQGKPTVTKSTPSDGEIEQILKMLEASSLSSELSTDAQAVN